MYDSCEIIKTKQFTSGQGLRPNGVQDYQITLLEFSGFQNADK